MRRVNLLKVGSKSYCGETVQDGFFDSILQLKTRDHNALESSPPFADFSMTYQNILEVCKNGDVIPPISEKTALDLLQKMKPTVCIRQRKMHKYFLYNS